MSKLLEHIKALFSRAHTAELRSEPTHPALTAEAEAMQEVHTEITALQARVTALEGKATPAAAVAVTDTLAPANATAG